MAEESKKKKDTAEVVEKPITAVDSITAAMVVQGAYIPDKTVIRFDYVFDLGVDGAIVYTYTALWIANKSRWYVSGITGGPVTREMENSDLAKALASPNTLSATTLVEGEPFK